MLSPPRAPPASLGGAELEGRSMRAGGRRSGPVRSGATEKGRPHTPGAPRQPERPQTGLRPRRFARNPRHGPGKGARCRVGAVKVQGGQLG